MKWESKALAAVAVAVAAAAAAQRRQRRFYAELSAPNDSNEAAQRRRWRAFSCEQDFALFGRRSLTLRKATTVTSRQRYADAVVDAVNLKHANSSSK